MQELPFLHSACRLMLIDICMKFREDSFRGFQVTERTRFVTDRQTDRQTDGRTSGRPGKNNMSPNPSGGDIIIDMPIQYNFKILRLHGCFICPTAKSLRDQIQLILHRVKEERS